MDNKNTNPHHALGRIELFIDKMHERGSITDEKWESLQDDSYAVAEKLPTTYLDDNIYLK
jgi:hypothetical protein